MYAKNYERKTKTKNKYENQTKNLQMSLLCHRRDLCAGNKGDGPGQ
jgi:hypothetical protein